MSWAATHTFTTGEVVTAATMNTISGDLDALNTKITATYVSTSDFTTSDAYADMASTGPTVTVTTGTQALLIVSAQISSDTAGKGGQVGVAVSGATTIAATDGQSLKYLSQVANEDGQLSRAFVYTGLTAGSNTFKMRYHRTGAGGTATFSNRELIVNPQF